MQRSPLQHQNGQASEDLSTLDDVQPQKQPLAPFAFSQQTQKQGGNGRVSAEPSQQEEAGAQPLNLATLVDRVRVVQKLDPTQLQTPPPAPAPVAPAVHTVPTPQQHEPEESPRWYSSIMGHRRHHHNASSSQSDQQRRFLFHSVGGTKGGRKKKGTKCPLGALNS